MYYLNVPWKTSSRAQTAGVDPESQWGEKVRADYIIQSVCHAFDILEQFLGNENGLSLTELSGRLGLSMNSIFRLLATLESRHYIEKDKHRAGYRLGYKSLQVGLSVARQMSVQQQAKPVLKSLTKASGETSDIAIKRGAHIIYLDAVETSHPVRGMPRVGVMTPAHCTAAGKVLLAGDLEREWGNSHPHMDLNRFTSKTITERAVFERHLQTVVTQGYAIEDEELDEGLRGVAAPVRNHDGQVVGAVSVSGPVMRLDKGRIRDELVPMVRRAAEELSLRLGYFPQAAAGGVLKGEGFFHRGNFS